ncbi:MAG: pyroglutamyl-peptidase [Limisphaerales bacterium]|jgi:pyroglutamyl-peptidase
MRFLITGFEPFGVLKENPTSILVERLRSKYAIVTNNANVFQFEVLPTVFELSAQILKKAIDEIQPDFILLCGVAEESNSIRLEKLALNVNHARIPDTEGKQPIDESAVSGEPIALESKVDLAALKVRLNALDIPAELSFHAGTYVCNHIYFHMLSYTKAKGFFMHVPNVPTANMSMEDLENAVTEIIDWASESALEFT